MAMRSLSLLRQQATVTPATIATATTTLLRRIHCRVPIFAKQNPSNVSRRHNRNKHELRARDAVVKHFSSLSTAISLENRPILSPNQAIGMVASAQANFMRVIVESVQSPEGSRSSSEESLEGSGSYDRIGMELLCVVKAVLKKIRRKVLVGDKVLVGSIDWVDRRGMIENVFERRSEISDPPIANVDHFLVCFSMEQPKLEPFALTRFLVEAESTGIPLTLALNKCELVSEGVVVAWKSRLQSWGYEPIFCSVESKHGLDTLAFMLRGRTTVIVGPSGVGKSSLINALRYNEQPTPLMEEGSLFDPISGSKWYEEQQVGEVSAKSGRGKHTTRNVSLLPLAGGGYLADTPGFNQPSLLKASKHSLALAFPEIQKRLQESEPERCAFKDCLHLGEPGCVVMGHWERYLYYFQLLDEIKIREEFQLRTMGTKREGDVRYKVGDMGVLQAEPRLEPKKHRRQSRRRMNQSILDELDELDDDNDDLSLAENPVIQAMERENQ